MLRTSVFAAALLTASIAHADKLDDYVRKYMADRKIPAVAWGIFKDGKVVKSRAYGLASVELKAPATTETVFEIGSVSKQFTATGILMLMEEGKVGLEDRIDKYVANLPEAWQSVTLRQLLTHTSGIPDMEEIFGYDSYRNIYTVQALIDVANSRPMDFAPGEKFKYSNTGYFLLGLALEKVSGKTYAAFLKERIFDPLGMTRTRESDPTAVIPNRAAGYQVDEAGALKNRDAMQPSACLGAGTLVSTLGDMAKWDGAVTTNRLLKPETQKLMWTPAQTKNGTVQYGLGWFTEPYRGHPGVEHSGGTAGFSCDYRRFHDTGYAVVVFTNLYATGVGGIELRVMDTVMPGICYASRPAIPDQPPIRAKLLKAMGEVAKGSTRPDSISEKMWSSYSEASHQAWKERMEGLKKFELISLEKHSPRPTPRGELGTETRIYRLLTKDQELYIVFVLDAEGKIVVQTREEG